MINGINILAEDIVFAESTWGWHPIAIITIGAFLIGIIVLIGGCLLSEKSFVFTGVMLIVLGIISTLSILSTAKNYYKYQYYCIIEDNVTFHEFYDNYEIIEHLGDNFYIIEPKNQEYFEQKGE